MRLHDCLCYGQTDTRTSCTGVSRTVKAVESLKQHIQFSLRTDIFQYRDAIQCLLGCTYGKANLIPRLRGKMAFTFFVRDENSSAAKAVRLFLKPEAGEGMSRDEYQNYLLNTPYTELFEVLEPRIALPEPARHFASEHCSVCGEYTAEYGLRLQDGKPVCLDCYSAYEREGF